MKKIVTGVFVGIAFLTILWVFRFVRALKYEDDPFMEVAEYYQPAPTPGSDLDVIEADAEIEIPSNAKEIHAMISGFRELETWVRFELPANEIELFLEGTLCTEPVASVKPTRYTRDELFDPEWWQPHQASDLVECHGGHQFIRQQILVDRSNNDIFTVYVFSFTDDFGTPTPNVP